MLRKVDGLRKRVVSVGKEHASFCAKVYLVIHIWFCSISWLDNYVVVIMLLWIVILTDIYEVLVEKFGIFYARCWCQYYFVLVEGMKYCLPNGKILCYLTFSKMRFLYNLYGLHCFILKVWSLLMSLFVPSCEPQPVILMNWILSDGLFHCLFTLSSC